MLRDKLALISGGGRGIGKAIALKFAEQGASVALLYAENAQAANDTAEQLEALGSRALCLECDITRSEQVANAVKQASETLGPISIVVNNAGITRDKLAVQMSTEDFEQVIDTNLVGAFNLIHHCYRGFMRLRAGRIINISSVAGIMGNAGQANYSAAKAGMIGLTKSIAQELASRGVTCNAIAPGLIETDMTRAMNQDEKETLLGSVPLRRMGTAEEVAALAAFLASDAASYITGAVIPIDGGLSM